MMENSEADGFPVFTSVFIHRLAFFEVDLSLLQLHHVLLVLLSICHLHMTFG